MISIEWQFREPPLAVKAVLAQGEIAGRLVERLLTGELAGLRGVGSAQVLVVIEESGRLPWVDGVTWLGVDTLAPALQLPTIRQPTVPLALFQRAVLTKTKSSSAAVVPGLIVPLDGARPLTREALERWRSHA